MDISSHLKAIYYTFFAGSTYFNISGKQVAVPNVVIFLLVFIVMGFVFRTLAKAGLRPILKTLKLV